MASKTFAKNYCWWHQFAGRPTDKELRKTLPKTLGGITAAAIDDYLNQALLFNGADVLIPCDSILDNDDHAVYRRAAVTRATPIIATLEREGYVSNYDAIAPMVLQETLFVSELKERYKDEWAKHQKFRIVHGAHRHLAFRAFSKAGQVHLDPKHVTTLANYRRCKILPIDTEVPLSIAMAIEKHLNETSAADPRLVGCVVKDEFYDHFRWARRCRRFASAHNVTPTELFATLYSNAQRAAPDGIAGVPDRISGSRNLNPNSVPAPAGAAALLIRGTSADAEDIATSLSAPIHNPDVIVEDLNESIIRGDGSSCRGHSSAFAPPLSPMEQHLALFSSFQRLMVVYYSSLPAKLLLRADERGSRYLDADMIVPILDYLEHSDGSRNLAALGVLQRIAYNDKRIVADVDAVAHLLKVEFARVHCNKVISRLFLWCEEPLPPSLKLTNVLAFLFVFPLHEVEEKGPKNCDIDVDREDFSEWLFSEAVQHAEKGPGYESPNDKPRRFIPEAKAHFSASTLFTDRHVPWSTPAETTRQNELQRCRVADMHWRDLVEIIEWKKYEQADVLVFQATSWSPIMQLYSFATLADFMLNIGGTIIVLIPNSFLFYDDLICWKMALERAGFAVADTPVRLKGHSAVGTDKDRTAKQLAATVFPTCGSTNLLGETQWPHFHWQPFATGSRDLEWLAVVARRRLDVATRKGPWLTWPAVEPTIAALRTCDSCEDGHRVFSHAGRVRELSSEVCAKELSLLIRQCATPGSLVIDPSCGGGATGVATMLAHPTLRFVGIQYGMTDDLKDGLVARLSLAEQTTSPSATTRAATIWPGALAVGTADVAGSNQLEREALQQLLYTYERQIESQRDGLQLPYSSQYCGKGFWNLAVDPSSAECENAAGARDTVVSHQLQAEGDAAVVSPPTSGITAEGQATRRRPLPATVLSSCGANSSSPANALTTVVAITSSVAGNTASVSNARQLSAVPPRSSLAEHSRPGGPNYLSTIPHHQSTNADATNLTAAQRLSCEGVEMLEKYVQRFNGNEANHANKFASRNTSSPKSPKSSKAKKDRSPEDTSSRPTPKAGRRGRGSRARAGNNNVQHAQARKPAPASGAPAAADEELPVASSVHPAVNVDVRRDAAQWFSAIQSMAPSSNSQHLLSQLSLFGPHLAAAAAAAAAAATPAMPQITQLAPFPQSSVGYWPSSLPWTLLHQGSACAPATLSFPSARPEPFVPSGNTWELRAEAEHASGQNQSSPAVAPLGNIGLPRSTSFLPDPASATLANPLAVQPLHPTSVAIADAGTQQSGDNRKPHTRARSQIASNASSIGQSRAGHRKHVMLKSTHVHKASKAAVAKSRSSSETESTQTATRSGRVIKRRRP